MLLFDDTIESRSVFDVLSCYNIFGSYPSEQKSKYPTYGSYCNVHWITSCRNTTHHQSTTPNSQHSTLHCPEFRVLSLLGTVLSLHKHHDSRHKTGHMMSNNRGIQVGMHQQTTGILMPVINKSKKILSTN